MNKHIINALGEYNFEFQKNFGYGFINGYEVNLVNIAASNGPDFYFSTYLENDKKNELINAIKSKKIKMLGVFPFETGIRFNIGAITSKAFEKRFSETIKTILEMLELFDAKKSEYCPYSGIELTEENSKYIPLFGNDFLKIKISNTGLTKLNDDIDKCNEEFQEAPNNYLKGLGGIVLGALIGVAIQIVLMLLGYVAAISAIVAIYLGIILYGKFGGKPNFMMVLMSLGITAAFLYGSTLFMYCVSATGYCQEANLKLYLFDALRYMLAHDAEFASEYKSNMIFTGVFILLGEIFSFSIFANVLRRPKKVEEKDNTNNIKRGCKKT